MTAIVLDSFLFGKNLSGNLLKNKGFFPSPACATSLALSQLVDLLEYIHDPAVILFQRGSFGISGCWKGSTGTSVQARNA